MRVLVIDDDEIVRQTVCEILQAAGHQTFELSSAMGATQLVFNEDIDVVIVDLMMPTISGDKLAQVLRSHAKGESLWIVLISSTDSYELRRLAKEVRANAFVRKSAVYAELPAALPARGAVRRSRAQNE